MNKNAILFLSTMATLTLSAAEEKTIPIKNNTSISVNLDLEYQSGQRSTVRTVTIDPGNTINIAQDITMPRLYTLRKIIIKADHAPQAEFAIDDIIGALAAAGKAFFVIEMGKPRLVVALTKSGQESYEQSSQEGKKRYKTLGIRVGKTKAEIKKYQQDVAETVSATRPEIPRPVVGIVSEYIEPETE